MKSIKLKVAVLAALAIVFTATLGAFIGVQVAAQNRYVTISGSSIFNTSGNAQVWAHREVRTAEDGVTEDPWYFTMFTFSSDTDAVSLRRNLAYEWVANFSGDVPENEDEAEYTRSVPTAGYLSLEIGFEALNFKKFTIAFEAQQSSMTKDEKTVNTVVFVPVPEQEDKVYAIIIPDENKKDAEEEADKLIEDAGALVPLESDHIAIRLGNSTDDIAGKYSVTVTNLDSNGAQTGDAQTGSFTNVGATYAKYVSSSSDPVTPIIFSSQTDAIATTSGARTRVAIYNLNGQSFALNRDDEGKTATTGRSINTEQDTSGEYYTGGQVNDTAAPVLCLDKGVNYIQKGGEISFNYVAIDVLAQSPSIETGYFMLTNEQAANAELRADDFTDKALFKTVTDSDDDYIIPHANHYVPEATGYPEGFTPVAAVKVYLKLTDTTSTGGRSTYVLLDWYVDGKYKVTVNDVDYIAVAEDKQGATYNYDGTDSAWKDEDGLVAAYQQKVDEAAKNLKAGADDFYLPSVESLVSDNATEYKDMTFTVYYLLNGSWHSQTNLASSKLKIDLEDSGDYKFTVYAHDGASNSMWYKNTDGTDKEFSTSDIEDMYKDEANEGLRDKLPWFTFSAGLAEITVTDPGEQDMAFVGDTYTAESFEVDGVSTTTTYSLYRFENDLYFKDNNQYLSYEDFMDKKEQLFDEYNYFTEIPEQSSLEEGSEAYELYYDYAWRASDRSFVPQEEDGFYLIVCTVASSRSQETVSGYMGIAAAAIPPAIDGENTWVMDNIASIVLLSIAGAALVGIVLLLVIRPKDKGDVDEQFEAETAKKKK